MPKRFLRLITQCNASIYAVSSISGCVIQLNTARATFVFSRLVKGVESSERRGAVHESGGFDSPKESLHSRTISQCMAPRRGVRLASSHRIQPVHLMECWRFEESNPDSLILCIGNQMLGQLRRRRPTTAVVRVSEMPWLAVHVHFV